ncbi:PQQ-binding-like beta-propeller repeat protein [Microbulbifer bruguierae]|uniref:PQQ-binding-like beta-propeller repeat protein n=1 Tax=Microbulbifer bruguierae TaxID=3029061 RepID=A0ABY8N813_9GAMM|nr:PQQ-binding-like beta-propeller repeat protein [Microbulbifer bruguierae]WGL15030.1 PQQ-binding-like beta-propeller repeat protein [Microbulbifer bruguierae]
MRHLGLGLDNLVSGAGLYAKAVQKIALAGLLFLGAGSIQAQEEHPVLVWDNGATEIGTEVVSQPDTVGGDYYFEITPEAAAGQAWRTVLRVSQGEAHLYMQQGVVPTGNGSRYSALVGDDAVVMRDGTFAAGEKWYIRVSATAGAEWTLVSGDLFVHDLGALAAYDSDASSAASITVGPEQTAFFKTRISGATKAWRLHLNGDEYPIYIKKDRPSYTLNDGVEKDNRREGDASKGYYSQMLLVPPYLEAGEYYISVRAAKGTVINLDSREQEIRTPVAQPGYSGSDNFEFSLTGTNDDQYGFITYAVNVPVEQLGWQVNLESASGNADFYVRKSFVPNLWINDAFSELPASIDDSVTVVPPQLTDTTWYVTVVGEGEFSFSMASSEPQIDDIDLVNVDPPIVNNDTDRSGWRYYRMNSNSLVDTVQLWELTLANQVANSEIALRRNALPARWDYRNGTTTVYQGSNVDESGTSGFLQQQNHEKDIWYVGVYTPYAALGAFELTTEAVLNDTLVFNGGSKEVTGQAADYWQYHKVTVPAGALGWDIQVTNVSGGSPRMVIRRDVLPDTLQSTQHIEKQNVWSTGNQWAAGSDWTGLVTNPDGSTENYKRLTIGLGSPLSPGNYYVGVYNAAGSGEMTYTLESRGIGIGNDSNGNPWSVQVQDLAFEGNVAGTALAPREQAYYRVQIPESQIAWNLTLGPASGHEAKLVVRKEALGNVAAYGNGSDSTYSYGASRDTAGGEVFNKFHSDASEFLEAGTYYVTVISQGQNPVSGRVGADGIDYTLSSTGEVSVEDKTDTPVVEGADVSWTGQGLSEQQQKFYRIRTGADLTVLELSLENVSGSAQFCVSQMEDGEIHLPAGGYAEGGYGIKGCSSSLLNLTAPTGDYLVTVMSTNAADVSFDLRASGRGEEAVAFNGGTSNTVEQAPGTWKHHRIVVPEDALGWDVRLKDISGYSTPQMVIRRDELPDYTSSSSNINRFDTWPSGQRWGIGNDWTGLGYEADGSYAGPGLTVGMGSPLEPGVYYVSVLNISTTQVTGYTLESRGIGMGSDSDGNPWAIQVQDLPFEGSAVVTGLGARELAIYRVQVPESQIGWSLNLDLAEGHEAALAVRREVIGNVTASTGLGNYSDSVGWYQGIKRNTDGAEYFYKYHSQTSELLEAGTYYVTVISQGQNPTSGRVGADPIDFTLTSTGNIPIDDKTDTPVASGEDVVWLAQSADEGEHKFYRIRAGADLTVVEVSLENVTGNTEICVIPVVEGEIHIPYFGYGEGGYSSRSCGSDLVNLTAPSDDYIIAVRSTDASAVSYDLVAAGREEVLVEFNGGSAETLEQAPGTWQHHRIEVPAGALGWDLRLSNVEAESPPKLVVRRDLLPENHGSSSNMSRLGYWTSGNQWAAPVSDWTGMPYEDDYSSAAPRMTMGMGSPLEPGIYYVSIYNNSTTTNTSYTLESRGIGIGNDTAGNPWSMQVQDLDYDGTASGTALAPRDLAFYRVQVPPSQIGWSLNLKPTTGHDARLSVRLGALGNTGGTTSNSTDWYTNGPNMGGRIWDTPGQEFSYKHHESYESDDDYLFIQAGTYYVTVISQGQNPVTGSKIGVGAIDYQLTSGPVMINDQSGTPITAETQVSWDGETLAQGEHKLYKFSVAEGLDSLELSLENTVGVPRMCVIRAENGMLRLPAEASGNSVYKVEGGYYPESGNHCGSGVVTMLQPAAGEYVVQVADGYDPDELDMTYDLVAKPLAHTPLAFDGGTDSAGLIDQQYAIYTVEVPELHDGEEVTAWQLDTPISHGGIKLWASQDLANLNTFVSTKTQAVLTAPYLTPGKWYVLVQGQGATDFSITSRAIPVRRTWTAPAHGEVFAQAGLDAPYIGDSGIDDAGNPIINPVSSDQGTDLAEGNFHFYRIHVPENNGGVIRTKLEALNGDPDLYIRRDTVPTLTHRYGSENLYDRYDVTSGTQYGNWVSMAAYYHRDYLLNGLPAGDWWIGVYGKSSNVRYRLTVSAGGVVDAAGELQDNANYVQDLQLDGGSVSGQTLAAGDMRYYRVQMPQSSVNAGEGMPSEWTLNLSEDLGDVVVMLRDTIPPGNTQYATSSYSPNYGTQFYDWSEDHNQTTALYPEIDEAGAHTFSVPPLEPNSTYYIGVYAKSDATFGISSAVSSETLHIDGVLEFASSGIDISLPAGEERLYRIDVPENAGSLALAGTYASTVKLYLNRDTVPTADSYAHWYSYSADLAWDTSFYADSTTTADHWIAGHSYYLRVINTDVDAQTVQLQFTGELLAGSDHDNDGIDDSWEVEHFGTISVTWDMDGDGLSNQLEFEYGTDPNNPDSDGDGLADGWEVNQGLDPMAANTEGDLDEDGLSDLDEFALGTDPQNSDSDADGLSDGEEVYTHQTNPRSEDTDADMMDDAWEVAHGFDPLNSDDAYEDADADGFANYEEYRAATDPVDSGSVVAAGSVLWSANLGLPLYGLALDNSGNLMTGDLYHLDRFGKPFWYDDVPGMVYNSATVDADGNYFVANGARIAKYTASGDIAWLFNTEGSVYRTGIALGEAGTLYVADELGNFYAVNADGSEKWRLVIDRPELLAPSIALDGTLYIATQVGDGSNYNLVSITDNGSYGSVNWNFPATGSFSAVAIAQDGTVYVASDDQHLYALNPDGTQKWAQDLGYRIDASPVIGRGGAVYIGAASSNRFMAFNPDGSVKWEYVSNSSRGWHTAVAGNRGQVFIANTSGEVIALDDTSGVAEWMVNVGGVTEAPLLDAYGRLYVVQSRLLSAIQTSATGLDYSDWPAEYFDSQNTARSTLLDQDGDGLADRWELEQGLDPADATDAEIDADGDGLTAAQEFAQRTSDLSVDSDGDGVNDDLDPFPSNGNESVDTDGDLIGNNADEDDDGDGVGDNSDVFPLDPTETADSDGDGVGDNGDAFPQDSTETVDSDDDGVGDNSDVFPQDPTESIDSDGDGIGDNSDPLPNGDDADSDSDGMPDGYEHEHGLDINDSSDADADLDGDGRTNLEEYTGGFDIAVDDVDPELTIPADIVVASTGPETPVDLGVATATDILDGNLVPTADNTGPFVPGQHEVTWTVADAAGNTASGTQLVDVIPLASIAVAQTVQEGQAGSIEVSLNGSPVSYPVTVSYTVSGSAGMYEDHDLTDGSVVIESGLTASIDFATLPDEVFEGSETLVVTLTGAVNAVVGASAQHVVSITEENVAPTVAIALSQDTLPVAVAYADAGEVTLTASVEDVNPDDTHLFQWNIVDTQLVPTNATDEQVLRFDPAGLSGSVEVGVTVTDSAGATSSAQVLIRIDSSLPVLLAETDSDGDGVSDLDEGVADSDGDRIPDYLDPQDTDNMLPASDVDNYLQSAAGSKLVLGDATYTSGNSVSAMSVEEMEAYFDASLVHAAGYLLLNGIFDFEVRGIGVGESTQVVLPLTSAILPTARYVKYQPNVGWVDFVEDGANAVATAPGMQGVCPAPGDGSYQAGLNEGDFCVQLTIQDGGPNDADGVANGVVVDPSAVATMELPAPVVTASNNTLEKTAFQSGDGEQTVLDFALQSDSTDAELVAFTFDAAGDVDDAQQVGEVKLYLDANTNGVAEASELIGTGNFAEDDGELTITLDAPYQLPVGESRFLVTYQL